jgi:hypothetical protein
LEKANICQGTKRLSDGTAADIEAFGNFLFGEFLTGGQFTLENPLRNGALNADS